MVFKFEEKREFVQKKFWWLFHYDKSKYKVFKFWNFETSYNFTSYICVSKIGILKIWDCVGTIFHFKLVNALVVLIYFLTTIFLSVLVYNNIKIESYFMSFFNMWIIIWFLKLTKRIFKLTSQKRKDHLFLTQKYWFISILSYLA